MNGGGHGNRNRNIKSGAIAMMLKSKITLLGRHRVKKEYHPGGDDEEGSGDDRSINSALAPSNRTQGSS